MSSVTTPPTSSSTLPETTSIASLSIIESATSTAGYNPNQTTFPSADPPNDSSNDFLKNGPSVYLYGFLATLVLILFVSIAVAWRGYYARRLLRSRIEEAMTRGVPLPGYMDGYPVDGSRIRIALGPKPSIYDVWLDSKGGFDTGSAAANGWNIKPTSVAIAVPYTPPVTRNASRPAPLSNARLLLDQFLAPLREFWFARPPEGTDPNQLQGRAPPYTTQSPSNSQITNSTRENDRPTDASETVNWDAIEGATVAVLIAMPNPDRSVQASRDNLGKGKGRLSSRLTSYSPSMPGRASTSQQETTQQAESEGHKLPELALGVTGPDFREDWSL